MKRKQIFIFGDNGIDAFSGGTAVVFAESFAQAKDLLTERKVSLYCLELKEIIDVEDLVTPQVLGAYVHSE